MIEIIIVGNVGSTRLHQTEKTTVLSLSIASSRKGSDDKVYTDWVSAKVWGDRGASLEKHIAKGQKILVRGRPEASAYARADGQPAAELIIHCRDIEFVGPKPEEGLPNRGKPKPRRRRPVEAT